MLSEQDTQPLPVTRRQETSEQRYRRLKAISEATGVRLLFVYLHDQKRSSRESRVLRKNS